MRELIEANVSIAGRIDDELIDELEQAAKPAETTAESLAVTTIRNMPRSPQWANMRIGVSRPESIVYMVPFQRGRKQARRPNLANLLLQRAMEPALEQTAPEIEKQVDKMMVRLAASNGYR